jgi:hypothetical protein
MDSSRSDDPAYKNEINILTGEFRLQKTQPEPIVNKPQHKSSGVALPAQLNLDAAITVEAESGWDRVHYAIENKNDKSNPKSPIHDFRLGSYVYFPPTYKGKDDWALEFGSELNASIEYWLAKDAINRVLNSNFTKDNKRIGDTGFTWVGPVENAYGRKIRQNQRTYHQSSPSDMINMMQDMEEYGVDKRTILLTAQVCYGKWFVDYFREEEPEHFNAFEDYWKAIKENSGPRYRRTTPIETQKTFLSEQYEKLRRAYDGYHPPMEEGYGNNEDCNTLRTLVTKDIKSPFWRDWLGLEYSDDLVRISMGKSYAGNEISDTIFIDTPELDTGLWQHLFSRDLYNDLGRVREEGLFSGLRYPERPKVVMLENRQVGSAVNYVKRHYRPKMRDGLNRSALFGDLRMNPEDFGTDDTARERTLNIERYRSSLREVSYGPMLDCRRSKDSVAFFKVGNALGRAAYVCNSPYSNQAGGGVAKIFDASGSKLTAAARSNVNVGLVVTIEFDSRFLTLDKRITRDNYCDDAVIKSVCSKTKPKEFHGFIESSMMNFIDPNYIIAFTQIDEEGNTQGVVIINNTKVVYNLNDIASWYRSYHPRTDKEFLSPVQREVQTSSLHYKDTSYIN